LAAGAKMGSSSITDTSAAMKNAGVAAKLAGLSFEEANVGVQLLAKGGLFAAEAGTGFRQVLLKLENEAEDKFKPSIMGLAGALENLAKENMSLTELTSLFGAEAMKSAAVMIDGAKDARTLEAAITGTSIASEMAATNFDNMEGDMLSLNSANEGLAITFGKMLEPAIRKSLKAATDLSRAFVHFIKKPNLPSGFYNAGFENLSLLELSKMIQKKIPCDVKIKNLFDPRSYRLDSSKLLNTGFKPNLKVIDAIDEITEKYKNNFLKDKASFYTVKWMKKLKLHKNK
jgi:hypothetical protein